MPPLSSDHVRCRFHGSIKVCHGNFTVKLFNRVFTKSMVPGRHGDHAHYALQIRTSTSSVSAHHWSATPQRRASALAQTIGFIVQQQVAEAFLARQSAARRYRDSDYKAAFSPSTSNAWSRTVYATALRKIAFRAVVQPDTCPRFIGLVNRFATNAASPPRLLSDAPHLSAAM